MINVRDLTQFQENKYTRHLVLKTDNVEILLVCWSPDLATAVHEHGPSDGVIMVLEGELENTNYYPDGREEVQVWKAGDIGHTLVGVQHKIENKSGKGAISLNIYSPALEQQYRGFDLGYDNQVELQEMQLPQEMVRYFMGLVPRIAAPADTCAVDVADTPVSKA
ncbi:MAG: cysteine dioxygenase family protein [Vampirovibrio sp.]|nr:cysteine dioxygenase family protein [Vampirovibrio sp.]